MREIKRSKWKQTGQWVQRFLWPEICPFCGRARREGICPACRKKTDELLIREPRCMRCGKPVTEKETEYCSDCAHTYHYYDRGVSLWLHRKPVSTSIYRFKYQNQRVFGSCYAQEIVRGCGAAIRKWEPDMIVPVPLHPARKRKRGYNQAEILAREIGGLTGIPVEAGILERVRDTAPQKALSHSKRRKNLQGAFAVRKRLEHGGKILLIDDIYTTGNTISSAAKVLKEAGAGKVYFLTISIGQGY